MEWTIILILSLLIVIQPFVLLYFIRKRKVDSPLELNGNSSSEMDLIIEYEKVDNGLPKKSSQSLILDLEDLDPIVSERTREKKKPRATIAKSDLNFRKQLAKKYPILTQRELNLCIHYRNGLTSRQISMMENMSYGSIRVYKTKIRQKLNLEMELEDFLGAKGLDNRRVSKHSKDVSNPPLEVVSHN